METLRIKCPSCGIILEVKNSKHEAVKRITCPSCKKQLAVTFADIPKPKPQSVAQPVGALYEGEMRHQLSEGLNTIPGVPSYVAELRVVRLTDGGCKHILRSLDSEGQVTVNGQFLHSDDEVVLMRGDELVIGSKTFTFDKPSKIQKPIAQPVEQTIVQPASKSGKNKMTEMMAVAAVLAGILVWVFWPSSRKEPQLVVDKDSVIAVTDTAPKTASPQKTEKTAKHSTKTKQEDNHTLSKESPKDDDFSLELSASKGNVKAQYQLGMRWVTSNNCSEVIKGVRYLEAAARSGHSEAMYALGVIFYKGSPSCGISRNLDLSRQYMLKAAANGSSKARRFLESNNDE